MAKLVADSVANVGEDVGENPDFQLDDVPDTPQLPKSYNCLLVEAASWNLDFLSSKKINSTGAFSAKRSTVSWRQCRYFHVVRPVLLRAPSFTWYVPFYVVRPVGAANRLAE